MFLFSPPARRFQVHDDTFQSIFTVIVLASGGAILGTQRVCSRYCHRICSRLRKTDFRQTTLLLKTCSTYLFLFRFRRGDFRCTMILLKSFSYNNYCSRLQRDDFRCTTIYFQIIFTTSFFRASGEAILGPQRCKSKSKAKQRATKREQCKEQIKEQMKEQSNAKGKARSKAKNPVSPPPCSCSPAKNILET